MTADLTDEISPHFHLKPVIGEPFSLVCPLESNPPVSYSWIKYSNLDRKELQAIPDDMVFSDDKHQWRVDWYDIYHNGLYVCHTSNSSGSQSYTHDTLFFLHADCKSIMSLVNLGMCDILYVKFSVPVKQ